MSTREELEALGRRAVACKGWRWIEGTIDTNGDVVAVALDNGYVAMASVAQPDGERYPPDFSMAASRGCLLELVRQAYGDPYIEAQPAVAEGLWLWRVSIRGDSRRDDFWYPSEAEALVAALEAAP